MFAAGSKNIIQSLTNTVVNNHNDGGAQVVNAMRQLEDHSSLGALYSSDERFDPPKCHPGTRTGVLQDIIDWINGITYMLWLYGSAGIGNSAIAHSTAEELESENRLAAAFFFSRSASGSHRDHEQRFIFTIALQLIETIPELKPFIVDAIIRTPSIWRRSLTYQVKVLILAPFTLFKQQAPQDVTYPWVIVVDGLDECREEGHERVLEALRMLCSDGSSFKVILTSRPEYRIKAWMSKFTSNEKDVKPSNIYAFDLNSVLGDGDVRLVFRDGTARIKESHILRHLIPEDWPSEAIIDRVVEKASGHFIYVSTLLKYIESPRHHDSPHIRLKRALVSDPSIATHDRPFADLDNLYLFILRNAEERRIIQELLALDIVRNDVAQTVGFIHLTESLVCKLSPVASLGVTFLDVGSIIKYPCLSIDDFMPYEPYHASFHDFLRDPIRSEEFFVDLSRWSLHFCLKVLELLHENVSRQQNGEDIKCLSEMAMQLSIKHLADPNVTSNLDILYCNVSDTSIDFFVNHCRDWFFHSSFPRDLEVHIPHSYIDETPLFTYHSNFGHCHFLHPIAYRLLQRRIMPLLHSHLQIRSLEHILLNVLNVNLSRGIFPLNKVDDASDTLNPFRYNSGWCSLLHFCFHYCVPGTPIFPPKSFTAALLLFMKDFKSMMEIYSNDSIKSRKVLPDILRPLLRSTLSPELAGLLPDATALLKARLEARFSRESEHSMLNTLVVYVEIYKKLSYLYEASGETDNMQPLPGNLTQQDLHKMRFGELAERAGLGGSYEPEILAEGGFKGFRRRKSIAEHQLKCSVCGVKESVENTV